MHHDNCYGNIVDDHNCSNGYIIYFDSYRWTCENGTAYCDSKFWNCYPSLLQHLTKEFSLKISKLTVAQCSRSTYSAKTARDSWQHSMMHPNVLFLQCNWANKSCLQFYAFFFWEIQQKSSNPVLLQHLPKFLSFERQFSQEWCHYIDRGMNDFGENWWNVTRFIENIDSETYLIFLSLGEGMLALQRSCSFLTHFGLWSPCADPIRCVQGYQKNVIRKHLSTRLRNIPQFISFAAKQSKCRHAICECDKHLFECLKKAGVPKHHVGCTTKKDQHSKQEGYVADFLPALIPKLRKSISKRSPTSRSGYFYGIEKY